MAHKKLIEQDMAHGTKRIMSDRYEDEMTQCWRGWYISAEARGLTLKSSASEQMENRQ